MKTLMLTTLGIVTVLGGSMAAIGQTATKTDEAESVPKVGLRYEVERSEPGICLMLVFDIPEGWHTYWPGQNDTGTPIVTTWTLPEGFTISKPRFPSPKRHIGGGGLLDYALEGKFEVLYTISGPPPKVGEPPILTPIKVPIEVQVDYLVCKEACVPHTATLKSVGTLTPLVTGVGCGTVWVERQNELRRTHPLSVSEWPKGQVTGAPDALNWKWIGNGAAATLSIRAIGIVDHLEFYPYEDSAELIEPITSGITDTGELKLTFKPQGKVKPGDKPKPVFGVVRVGSGPTSPTYEIKIDIPSPADTTAAKPAESSAPLPPPLPPVGNNPPTVPPAK